MGGNAYGVLRYSNIGISVICNAIGDRNILNM